MPRFILIKEHKHGSCEIIKTNLPGNTVIELYQKREARWSVSGNPPAITWKVANATDFIEAMIESASL